MILPNGGLTHLYSLSVRYAAVDRDLWNGLSSAAGGADSASSGGTGGARGVCGGGTGACSAAGTGGRSALLTLHCAAPMPHL